MAPMVEDRSDISPDALTPEVLIRSSWQFSHENGPVDAPALQFAADGRVSNYNHPNERRWKIEDGVLCLAKDDGTVTVRFNRAERREQRLFLSGRHLPNPAITLCLTELHPGWRQRPGTKVDLAVQIRDFGWSVGDHTYGHPRFLEPGLATFTVGKYTSIASGVIIALGNHRMDTVSTYPFSTLRHYWPSVPEGVHDHDTKGDVTIGNDVWIGTDVFICSGVTVGDGAVIGAKSVITRDVPPYAVLAGNPGRVVRSRFSERQVAMLLEMQWWNWPDEVVDSFLPLMMSGDVDQFVAAAYRTTRTSKDTATQRLINNNPSWLCDRPRATSD